MPQTVELPVFVKVTEMVRESADLCTIWLDRTMPFAPGQFVMIWIPRIGEKPYTLSYVRDDRIAFTVRKRGDFSTLLTELKPGERIGIRGPYGKGFNIKRPGILVAGGCGLAPLAPLRDTMPEAPLIVGAKTAGEIMFRERFPDMIVCTDDGSLGHAGFPTDLLRPRLEAGEAKAVYTCGPEVMMKAVFEVCEGFHVECQAGLERYMKCGFGVCGQCSCGEMLVCKDGPVFDSDALRSMAEFGRTARLKSGRRVSVEDYANWRKC